MNHNKINASKIITFISLIGSMLSILSFFGFYGTKNNAIFIIITIILLGICFFINRRFLFNKIKKNISIDYESILKDTELLPSLISVVNNKKGNNIHANVITYTYKIINKNELMIYIDIDGISEYDNMFSICLLDKDENAQICVICNKNEINPYSIQRENNYTEYNFNLPNLQKNIKVRIKQTINVNQHSNLFFVPYNYVSEVNIIKIKVNKSQIACYEIVNRKCELPISINVENNKVTLDGKTHIKSIFVIKDYKKEYNKTRS